MLFDDEKVINFYKNRGFKEMGELVWLGMKYKKMSLNLKGENMKFKVANINCENCANTIKAELEELYGDIDIDVAAKELSVNILSDKLESFKADLAQLGFEIIE